ncbi:MAG: long-chain fatty acid--CoA ligase, partial [Ghiorsea sp.]|nr:long-chain fatty acid--CoA ligase [Ghiorsea sp.]
RVNACASLLKTLGMVERDRVAILMENCPDWVVSDQAALSLNMITVPLFHNDRPENMAYVLHDSGARVLFIDHLEHWQKLQPALQEHKLEVVILVKTLDVLWQKDGERQDLGHQNIPASLATIVYTSGTTGNPKGVMLSHQSILENASAAYAVSNIYPSDTFLSFLPLSHAFERTVGYYLPMLSGATVAFARSILTLQEDLVSIAPTVMVTVPRMFEKIDARLEEKLAQASKFKQGLVKLAEDVGFRHFEIQQGKKCWHINQLLYPLLDKMVGSKVRTSLGGRLRVAVSGGAPLSTAIGRRYLGFGVPIIQGYGLTEYSPVVSSNRLQRNNPACVGEPLQHTEVNVAKDNGELLIRGAGVMLGYWQQDEATHAMIDEDGWLHSGDIAKIVDGQIYITGRIKDILVLSNGEKVPPTDIEDALLKDSWVDQVMVVGEGKAFLVALIVPSEQGKSVDKRAFIQRFSKDLHAFPGYEKIKGVVVCETPWTIEEGLLTPTMKLRRVHVLDKYQTEVDKVYVRLD